MCAKFLRMKIYVFATLYLLFPSVALSACPASPDIRGDLDNLISQARAAPNESAGRDVSNKMWELWLKAPDAAAQEVLDSGMKRRSSYDFLGAIEQYTKLIEYCPDYAEGYNQRAFIYYLQSEFEQALKDLDKALVLSSNHVGAQSGRALTLLQLGRLAEARQQLIAALDNNPWLSERYLMLEGGPLASIEEDI